MSSAGVLLTNTFGTAAAARPGTAARTSFKFSSAGSFAKLGGSVPAAVHGPATLVAFSHAVSCRR
jgi:hypothetical protein